MFSVICFSLIRRCFTDVILVVFIFLLFFEYFLFLFISRWISQILGYYYYTLFSDCSVFYFVFSFFLINSNFILKTDSYRNLWNTEWIFKIPFSFGKTLLSGIFQLKNSKKEIIKVINLKKSILNSLAICFRNNDFFFTNEISIFSDLKSIYIFW